MRYKMSSHTYTGLVPSPPHTMPDSTMVAPGERDRVRGNEFKWRRRNERRVSPHPRPLPCRRRAADQVRAQGRGSRTGFMEGRCVFRLRYVGPDANAFRLIRRSSHLAAYRTN